MDDYRDSNFEWMDMVLKKINKLYKKLSKKHTCYKINLFDINLKEKVFFNQCNSDDTIII